jgi:hypothetical protein
VGEATPFEDVENALTLLQERATTIDSTDGFEWTTYPGPARFETNESGEPVEYIFDEGDLYRVVA